MSALRVYDEHSKEFRELNPLNYNDDYIIGAVLFSRNALPIIREYCVVCGYVIISKEDHSTYPIDIQEDKIVMLEGTYNCLPCQLKKDLVRYNMVEKKGRLWSRFFLCWEFWGDWNCFDDNGPFIKMCANLLGDNNIISKMLANSISVIEPTNYDELSEMTKAIFELTNADYITPDYVQEFKYSIDALLHHYHINCSDYEIEKLKYQLCILINKQWEDNNGHV